MKSQEGQSVEEDVTVEVTWVGLKSAQESKQEIGMRRVCPCTSLSLPLMVDPCPQGLALPLCADSEVKRPFSDFAVSVSSIF